MVHNLIETLPIEAVENWKPLRKQTKNYIGFSLESFEQVISGLSEDNASELVGPTASNQKPYWW